jgi:hypothetical protein
VIIPCMHTVYLRHIHSPPPIIFPLLPLSPPFHHQCLVDFIMLSSYVQMQCPSILFTLQCPFLSPFSLLLTLPPHTHLCPFIIIILYLDSTNVQEHEMFDLLSLAYLTQHFDLQSYRFFCK